MGIKRGDERFALFSKSGFVDGLVDELDDKRTLIDIDELGTLL
ncbi:hypothetical protein [Halalkalicoccus subterraneus]|nr:hypothetical protein [Halalkalicoccus subterraneus]